MRPKRTDSVPVRVDILPFRAPAQDLGCVRCAKCGSELELHQPDDQIPDRLIGICRRCSTWFLVDLVVERSEVMIFRLPGKRVPGEGPK